MEHNRKEESVVYPRLKRELTEAEPDAVLQGLHSQTAREKIGN